MSYPSSNWLLVLKAGFAMFSMFFGSGNLVYPLMTGSITKGSYPYAILGFIMTAVCVPFLGLMAMILHQGDRNEFFKDCGRYLGFLLTFMILALLGPFATIPRCITVAYGGIAVMTDAIAFPVFSITFCLIMAAIIWQRSRIIDIIALFLTPFKFGSIILLIVVGVWFGYTTEPSTITSLNAFQCGASEGYQTLDLMAGFFFSCAIYEYLRSHLKKNDKSHDVSQLFRLSVCSSLLGASLLTLVYLGFIALGAEYAPFLKDVHPTSMLVTIAKHALGNYGMPLVALTLAVSCLATATILSTLFADFLHTDIFREKISRSSAIIITMAMSFIISLFGFGMIRTALGTILSWIYPLLIAYTVWRIIRVLFHMKSSVVAK